MRDYLNLKGETIGWLTVLELSNICKGTTKTWKCRCKCGNITHKLASKLIDAKKCGYNLSCGCAKTQENLIGKIFGDFKILKYIKHVGKTNRLWKCQCTQCGSIKELTTFQLKKNKNICEEVFNELKQLRHKLHECFLRIKNRCYNPSSDSYKYYGGRNINICDEWLQDSNKFVDWAIANGYTLNCKLSIDRIDSNKGYSPENCRWVTTIEQANNKRNNIYYTYNGRTQSLAQWCRELNLNYKYVHYLIKNKKLEFCKAIMYRKRG